MGRASRAHRTCSSPLACRWAAGPYQRFAPAGGPAAVVLYAAVCSLPCMAGPAPHVEVGHWRSWTGLLLSLRRQGTPVHPPNGPRQAQQADFFPTYAHMWCTPAGFPLGPAAVQILAAGAAAAAWHSCGRVFSWMCTESYTARAGPASQRLQRFIQSARFTTATAHGGKHRRAASTGGGGAASCGFAAERRVHRRGRRRWASGTCLPPPVQEGGGTGT